VLREGISLGSNEQGFGTDQQVPALAGFTGSGHWADAVFTGIGLDMGGHNKFKRRAKERNRRKRELRNADRRNSSPEQRRAADAGALEPGTSASPSADIGPGGRPLDSD
jgi:hypothetical protein